MKKKLLKNNGQDLVMEIEAIDHCLALAFNKTNTDELRGAPTSRFQLLFPLLSGLAPYSLGFNSAQIEEILEASIGKKGLEALFKSQKEFSNKIRRVQKATYICASYWSPIDGVRRSLVHRPKKVQKENKALAAAYLFFALTHSGLKKNLYSATQYVVDKAPNKFGPRTCFAPECINSEDCSSWKIASNIWNSCLLEIGIGASLISIAGVSSKRLSRSLRNVLGQVQGWEKDSLASHANRIVNRIVSPAFKISNEMEQYVESTQRQLNDLYRYSIDKRQAFFMLMTQLLWREATPGTNIMYTYPVHIANTWCVLTVGTESHLSINDSFVYASTARSLFVHPLIQDYESLRMQAVLRQGRHVRALAHEAINLVAAAEQAADTAYQTGEKNLLLHLQTNLEDAVLLLRNLGTAERINMGDFPIQPQRENLRAIIGEIISRRKIVYRNAFNQVNFKFRNIGPAIYTMVDKLLIQRALENLLVNAARFSPNNGIVRISLQKRRNNACITVTDNGPGIPEPYTEYVFGEFNVLHPKHSKTINEDYYNHGSGLGLFITRHIISAHNGRVWIDKKFTNGCSVIIQLPLV